MAIRELLQIATIDKVRVIRKNYESLPSAG